MTIRIACNSNLSLCYLKLERFEKVLLYTSRVLDEEPHHFKALLRSSVALLARGDLDLALERAETALDINPEDDGASKQVRKVKKKLKKFNEEASTNMQRAFMLYSDDREESK